MSSSIDSPPSYRHSPSRFTPSHPPRILLAEDDDEMRSLVATSLRADGYDVTEVNDGGRLLVRVADAYVHGTQRVAYDLLISDIRMPVCSGLQILESLRKARWPTPVILMTAFGDDDTRKRADDLGALLFDKPFDVDDLRTAVLNYLPYSSRPWPPSREELAEDEEEIDTLTFGSQSSCPPPQTSPPPPPLPPGEGGPEERDHVPLSPGGSGGPGG